MPDAIAAVFQELVRAYEAEDSIEARLAHDADKLETLLLRASTRPSGATTPPNGKNPPPPPYAPTRPSSSPTQILATTPTSWWSAFGRSYTELRKQTRGMRDARSRTPGAPGAA